MIIFEIKIDIIKRLLTELNTIIYSPETSQLKKKKKRTLSLTTTSQSSRNLCSLIIPNASKRPQSLCNNNESLRIYEAFSELP